VILSCEIVLAALRDRSGLLISLMNLLDGVVLSILSIFLPLSELRHSCLIDAVAIWSKLILACRLMVDCDTRVGCGTRQCDL